MKMCSTTHGVVALLLALSVTAAENVAYDHAQDIVYGYKDGMALVMDVFTPSEGDTNGAGVVWVNSGGMHSDPRGMRGEEVPGRLQVLLDSGYVVFAASHGSQPKYTLPEIQHDMPRAVRYIRHNAERFGIDGNRIGVMGFSSGGQLTLQLTTEALGAQPDERDPVDQESSRVQAAVAYFPGTDLVNFGKKDTTIVEHFSSVGEGGLGPFDFKKWDDARGAFVAVDDREERSAIFAACSPITHVSADDPPVLLFHGDKDELVPMQQSETFHARMEAADVTSKLVVVPGKGHGWGQPVENEFEQLTGWFDEHLLGDDAGELVDGVPSIVGKTITTQGDDGEAEWVFGEDGEIRIDGMLGTYEQDGRDIFITMAGFDFQVIYDGEALQFDESFAGE